MYALVCCSVLVSLDDAPPLDIPPVMCVSTVVLLITSPFVIDTLYHTLMIC
jgi:CRISPR/Cas system CMR subunit Cmr4 (Cas7 group RAMP superfamily)